MTNQSASIHSTRGARRFGVCALILSCTIFAGCVDPVSIIASSVLSAAVKSAVRSAAEQAENSRPTPEGLWREAQLKNLQGQARAGSVEAQFNLGTYYIQIQESQAQEWICAAANQGHALAQLQYGHWFNEDRVREDLFPFINITPNNADAFLWYSLAAQNGEPRATHFRDSLIYSGIQTAKLDHARARLANWSSQDCGTVSGTTLTAAQSREGLTVSR